MDDRKWAEDSDLRKKVSHGSASFDFELSNVPSGYSQRITGYPPRSSSFYHFIWKMVTSYTDPSPSSMQVTISLLPVSLSLVHVPRSRLAQLSHPVLRQILQPSPTFLNVTCNEIELSIFAEHYMLADFEPIARQDRQKQRSRSGSGSTRKNITRPFIEPVEISYEKWNVLQIDSHSDQLGT